MEGGIEWAGNELMFTLVNEKLISRSLFRFHKQGHNSDNFEQPDAVCVFVKEFSFSLIFCVVCFWVSWALILYLPTCDINTGLNLLKPPQEVWDAFSHVIQV